MITLKMWPLECKQCFPLIQRGDLAFYLKYKSVEADLKYINTNISNKIHNDCLKKTWLLDYQQSVPLIWPGDQVFDLVSTT